MTDITERLRANALERAAHIAVLTHNGGFVATEDRADSAIDSAMAKDGA